MFTKEHYCSFCHLYYKNKYSTQYTVPETDALLKVFCDQIEYLHFCKKQKIMVILRIYVTPSKKFAYCKNI